MRRYARPINTPKVLRLAKLSHDLDRVPPIIEERLIKNARFSIFGR